MQHGNETIIITLNIREARKLIEALNAGVTQAQSVVSHEQATLEQFPTWGDFPLRLARRQLTTVKWGYKFIMGKIYTPENLEISPLVNRDRRLPL